MNYALTIQKNMITAIHENALPFTDKTFKNSPEFASQQILPISTPFEYQVFDDIRCYTIDGIHQDFVWCIEKGYMAMPEGCEIVDGKLVDFEVPFEEAPLSIRQIMSLQQSKIDQLLAMAETFSLVANDLATIKEKVRVIETKEQDLPTIDIPIDTPPEKGLSK